MVIQHNLTSMYGDMVLKNTNYKLNKTIKKLSSGYRINSAADDAAGLAISEKMRGQIRGLERADNNIEEVQEAIMQISDRKYASELWDEGYREIKKYGIAFFKKGCLVKYQD